MAKAGHVKSRLDEIKSYKKVSVKTPTLIEKIKGFFKKTNA